MGTIEDKGLRNRIVVEEYTGGLIGPSLDMVGTLKDGGTISTISPPGCWGPMITPEFLGGHEVSRPVAVQGARVGDAVAIFIQKVWVRSQATSSGTMVTKAAAFGSDPFVDKHCPNCKTPWPASRIEGTGPECVRCVACGAEASPFAFEEGYTIAFDEKRQVGITVGEKAAADFATRAYEVAALPKQSRQHPILLYKPHTIPGTLSRLQAFIGNIGTLPSKDMPDSHNAGDFGKWAHMAALSASKMMWAFELNPAGVAKVSTGTISVPPRASSSSALAAARIKPWTASRLFLAQLSLNT